MAAKYKQGKRFEENQVRDIVELAQTLKGRGWKDVTSDGRNFKFTWPATGKSIRFPKKPKERNWKEKVLQQADDIQSE